MHKVEEKGEVLLFLMRRILLIGLLVAIVCLLMTQSPNPTIMVWVPIEPHLDVAYVANAQRGVRVTAHAAVLLESTSGTVLYAHNEHIHRAPASITKVMTALLALETGRLDDIVRVSKQAAGIHGSSANLFTGQEIRFDDLLYGMLLRSGNDAAVAVAEHLAGSVPEFAQLMNERARELGAVHTNFTNPHGLDQPNHYSTAFDLAMISRVALLYPKFAEIVGTISYLYNERSITWRNTNRLLWSYAGTEGIKTGTTGKAGPCLAAAASREGMQLITVVLGSSNRWQDTIRLLEYGFNQFQLVQVAKGGQIIAEIKPPNSIHSLGLVPADDLLAVIRTGSTGTLSTIIKLDKLQLPISRHQQLGVCEVYADGVRIADIPLLAARAVPRPALWKRLYYRIIGGQQSPPA